MKSMFLGACISVFLYGAFLAALGLEKTKASEPPPSTELTNIHEPPKRFWVEIDKGFYASMNEHELFDVLDTIAGCESGWTHYIENKDGSRKVLRGKINSEDIGYLQVNKTYHEKKAQNMGIDIYTLSGNIEYSLHLAVNDGLYHWNPSRYCWKNGVYSYIRDKKITTYSMSPNNKRPLS